MFVPRGPSHLCSLTDLILIALVVNLKGSPTDFLQFNRTWPCRLPLLLDCGVSLLVKQEVFQWDDRRDTSTILGHVVEPTEMIYPKVVEMHLVWMDAGSAARVGECR